MFWEIIIKLREGFWDLDEVWGVEILFFDIRVEVLYNRGIFLISTVIAECWIMPFIFLCNRLLLMKNVC